MGVMVRMPFPGVGKSVFLSQKRDHGDPTGNREVFCTVQPERPCPATAPRNAKGYGREKALSAAGKAMGRWM